MKKFLNIFAAIVALCSFIGCYEEIDLVDGTAYTTINYTTNDNEIAYIRTGQSGMHVISNTYTDGVGKVVVKGKITHFYPYFEYCDNVTSVTIPKGVTTIGSYAFNDCDNLKSIVIPEGVTEIESSAFAGCYSLASVTLPKTLVTIGSYAFHGCNNLKTVINKSKLNLTKGSSSYGYVAYYADKITQNEPSYNNRSYVDLGLPSGVKWATYNIGATKPEELGNSYYWGETTTSMVNNTMYVNVGDNISGNAKYDAARAQWGGDWRLPTQGDFSELVDKCNWYWSSYNGVSGYKIYGPNGNYIFLPYTSNYYWSGTSSQWNEPNDAACILKMESDLVSPYYHAYRNSARRIRPVIN